MITSFEQVTQPDESNFTDTADKIERVVYDHPEDLLDPKEYSKYHNVIQKDPRKSVHDM